MNLEIFKQNFERRALGNKILLAQRTVKSGRVIRFKESFRDDNTITINGNVLSSNNRRVHNVHIEVSLEKNDIKFTECNCREAKYEHNTYICKHIAAVILRYIEILSTQATKHKNDDNEIFKELEMLKSSKELLNLEVNLKKEENNLHNFIQAEFKIGKQRLYLIKNLKEFINNKVNKKEMLFGKGFLYDPKTDMFNNDDDKIIDFIEEQVCNDNFTQSFDKGLVKGKYLNITENSFRRFWELLIHKDIVLNGESIEVINSHIPINININSTEDNYVIDMDGKEILPLSRKYDVCLVDNKIYLPPKEQSENLFIFHKYIRNNNKLCLKKDKINELANLIIPRLEKITSNIKKDLKELNYEKFNLKSEFYLDKQRGKIILEVKLIYGEEVLSYFKDNNTKIIVRDEDKEKEILTKIINLNFISQNGIFVFNGDEEDEFDFLTRNYKELESLGDVFYSDSFKKKTIYNSPIIHAEIKENDNSYLDFSFNIEGINSEKYKDIIYALKNNKRFYKLEEDTFINLQDKRLKALSNMMDHICDDAQNVREIKIPKGRAYVMNEFLDNKTLDFVKGKKIIEDIFDKMENIDSISYELPQDLNAELRNYQITGFKWFKTLSYLGLGGVLADEMGLGKTIQTISFLLSEQHKKSLIICPMSLIYNWKNEFLKFAPSMKIGIVHGSKSERESIINNLNKYDILLTTYGSLRNDEELYNNISFDYFILDEGQNIKNPLSKVSKAVKSIKAKVRFVLTGTPIENNLMELWSIFDFLMPGYLYSSSLFKKKFINNKSNNDILKQYIKPFILRRIKSDVIKELPSKIEKKHYIELNTEQKKIYMQYVKEIKDTMEKSSFEKDKITLFSYLMKLRQICLDPSLVISDYKGGSSKINEALRIIKENIKDNHKILLFSQFTSVLEKLKNILYENNIKYLYLDGKTKANERIELVDKFNKNKEYDIFLISLKAGGTGLNLTSADIVIHFDPWYNPAIENQATDRAHRIGQTEVVKVFKLISQGTVEDRIVNLQEEKKKLVDSIVDADYKNGNSITNLSKEEFIKLFLS